MSVIVQLRIPGHSFELGRILRTESGTEIHLENMVPLGERAIPFLSVHDADVPAFERAVREHPSVRELREVSASDDVRLYALDWVVSRDLFFEGLLERRVQLLSASGGVAGWEFELRFPDYETYEDFKEYCSNARIPLEVGRLYNPTGPDAGVWYGLTSDQRDTLLRAVEGGYYSIPRGMSTKELASEFDISDQAVTERLRRAIITLVENTLFPASEPEYEPVE
jgi:hypothetical protein